MNYCLQIFQKLYRFPLALFFFAIFCISLAISNGKADSLVQMRVVKETANYGYFGNNLVEGETAKQLVASVPASNFSGPELLRRLFGKCYNLTLDKYKYIFCPFQNFTQYETSTRWNSYQGILGVWSHWYIKNNTFSAMVYKNGDRCGDVDRSVKIFLECGAREGLLNVTEPDRCQYSALFSTRYVCHRDALLVYPRLNRNLQKRWNELHTEYHYGYITNKGYELGLAQIFQEAGLQEMVSTTTPGSSTPAPLFNDLSTCNEEYNTLNEAIAKLNTQIEGLKKMIDSLQLSNRAAKTNK